MTENSEYNYFICYILVDNERLFYYNQLLISIASLRKRNPHLPVIVLLDEETKQILPQKNPEFERWHISSMTISVPKEYEQKARSRFIKTSVRQYVRGDYLYIDTDTVIAATFPVNISNKDLSLTLDWNDGRITNEEFSTLKKTYDKCGYELNSDSIMYNSGVIWAKDNAIVCRFYQKWHYEWKQCYSRGILLDQPSLNHVNSVLYPLISELPCVWNVQVSCVQALRFLNNAIIIHYYNVSWERMRAIYSLSNPEIQSKGYKSIEVQSILENPKDALYPSTFLRRDETTDEVMYCKAFATLKWLYMKHHRIYRGINYVLSIPSRIRTLIKKIKSDNRNQ